MKTQKFSFLICAGVMLVFLTINAQIISAQNDYQSKRAKAFELVKQNKITDAQPLFEELAAVGTDDPAVLYYAGFLTASNAQNIKDTDLRRKAGLRARGYLLKAQQLGVENELLRNMLGNIAPDGTIDQLKFSNIAEADKALHAGEEAFARGDFKKAIESYGKALELDPQLYDAALYTGDVYFKSDDSKKAGEWFAKAIAIDPNRETAYRYWGDSLAKEGKKKESRDKFIDAFVAEPYNKYASSTLVNWANQNGVTLAHPAINIPTSISSSGGNSNITLDPSLLDKNKKDGSSAWLYYGITRAAWNVPGKDGKLSDRFAKAYPNETIYRHSLAEEADALRQVLSFLDKDIKDKKVETLDASLANLKKLNDAGLLEAYILMARLDAGLFQDYKSYRNTNRDKLRRYVNEFIMNGEK